MGTQVTVVVVKSVQWKIANENNKLLHDSQSNNFGANNSNMNSDSSGPNAEPVLSCISNNREKSDLLFRVRHLPYWVKAHLIGHYVGQYFGEATWTARPAKQFEFELVRWKLITRDRNGRRSACQWCKQNEKILFENVYGVSNLKLPTQCFNMDVNTNNGVPISSYNNVAPKLVIRLDHCRLGLPDEIVPFAKIICCQHTVGMGSFWSGECRTVYTSHLFADSSATANFI